jgi:cell division protein FtsQ
MTEEQGFLRPTHRRTVPRRRRRLGWVLGVLAVVAGAVPLGRFLTGPRFGLRAFQIDGNRHVRTEEVLRTLEPWRGRNLLFLDLRPLAGRLTAHPWIAQVTLSKSLPSSLYVHVAERAPIALYRKSDGLWWVGPEGQLIGRFDPRLDSGDAPLLSGDPTRLPDEVALLEALRKGLPGYAEHISEISALSDEGFVIMDSIFRMPIKARTEDAPEKIRALLHWQGVMEARGLLPRAIDLRFANRIVLEGAYGLGNKV